MDLGLQLRGLRKNKKLTMEQAGQLIGIDMGQLCRYENGHVIPGGKVLRKIAAFYDVPVSSLTAPAETASNSTLLAEINVTDEEAQELLRFVQFLHWRRDSESGSETVRLTLRRNSERAK